jgi:hypothetical protein
MGMRWIKVLIALAGVFPLGGLRAEGELEPPRSPVRFGLQCEVASGYLSSSGTLGDTWPVSTQCLDFKWDLGEHGNISGYGWTVSSLHNRQHDRHRALFNQYESAIYYGRDFAIADKVELHVKGGPLWNPAIGYPDGHNNTWGFHFIQSLSNPWVVPYMNGLWIVQPSPRARIRFGVSRKFAVSDNVGLEPFVETVWMDNRRFQSRYGGIPQDRFLGGAFATLTTGMKLTWQVCEDLQFFVRLRQFDTINSQSRKAIKHRDDYYAKRDWPVLGVGARYCF